MKLKVFYVMYNTRADGTLSCSPHRHVIYVLCLKLHSFTGLQ